MKPQTEYLDDMHTARKRAAHAAMTIGSACGRTAGELSEVAARIVSELADLAWAAHDYQVWEGILNKDARRRPIVVPASLIAEAVAYAVREIETVADGARKGPRDDQQHLSLQTQEQPS